MARVLIILLVVSLMLTAGTCQTFQYSRGWRNGKRSNDNPNHVQAEFPSEFEIANYPVHRFNEYSNEISTPSLSSSSSSSTHCNLQKLRMMLQGNGNEELYLLPCEFLGGLQRPYQQQLQRRRVEQ